MLERQFSGIYEVKRMLVMGCVNQVLVLISLHAFTLQNVAHKIA